MGSRVWSYAEPAYDLTAQQQTPYADAVYAHAKTDQLSLMVPGHGSSKGSAATALDSFFESEITDYDLPLMLDGVDLGPDSPLVHSRKLAAEAWGADTTWFLTNGASQANRIAAIAVRGLGKHILMQRSSHSSFIDGMLASGLSPSFIMPNIDHDNGAAHGVTPQALEEAFANSTEQIGAVYVISPSYFGATADVAALADIAHRNGAALIVDGAWGAHFGFHAELPESPARLGADLVVSSTHKLAGSLTQSAMLHLGKGEFAERLRPLVDRAYSMTASTSSSSILMASLDIARRTIATGYDDITKSIQIANELRDRLRADPRFGVLCDTFEGYDDIVAVDPLRIAIDVSKLAQNGHWVHNRLLKKHRVYCEMSTATVVVAVIGAGAHPDIDRVMSALDECAQAAGLLGDNPTAEKAQLPALPDAGKLAMLPRDAYFAEIETVPAAEAVGRISVDSLASYPPGIPNVLPGEVITEQLVSFLTAVANNPNGYVRGAVDAAVSHYRVVKE